LRALAGPNAGPEVRAPTFGARSTFLDLGSAKVPTLVICGTEDTVTPPELSKAIVEGVAGARIVWIEGAGHLSNIERPREFNRALRDFLLEQPR
jgi:pimeloyl-ACP methyl ester carboxylesterase